MYRYGVQLSEGWPTQVWVVTLVAILSTTLSESAIDSLQNAIVDNISGVFLQNVPIIWTRLLVVLLNIPVIIVSLQVVPPRRTSTVLLIDVHHLQNTLDVYHLENTLISYHIKYARNAYHLGKYAQFIPLGRYAQRKQVGGICSVNMVSVAESHSVGTLLRFYLGSHWF